MPRARCCSWRACSLGSWCPRQRCGATWQLRSRRSWTAECRGRLARLRARLDGLSVCASLRDAEQPGHGEHGRTTPRAGSVSQLNSQARVARGQACERSCLVQSVSSSARSRSMPTLEMPLHGRIAHELTCREGTSCAGAAWLAPGDICKVAMCLENLTSYSTSEQTRLQLPLNSPCSHSMSHS